MAITNDEIKELVKYFRENGIKLYHSCQLIDFKSYIELKGIPSRQCLEDNRKSFTPFTSDETDKKKDVWSNVFFNFSDIGGLFHERKLFQTPNVYGPILIEMEPECLLDASEIFILLCSATDKDINIKDDSLSLTDVKNIFNGKYLKKISVLEALFPQKKIKNAEMNCVFNNVKLPQRADIKHVSKIIVDPILLSNIKLIDLVKTIGNEYDHFLSVLSQERQSMNLKVFELLIELSLKESFTKNQIYSHTDLCARFEIEHPGWLGRVANIMDGYIISNYLNYLSKGTIKNMKEYSIEQNNSEQEG